MPTNRMEDEPTGSRDAGKRRQLLAALIGTRVVWQMADRELNSQNRSLFCQCTPETRNLQNNCVNSTLSPSSTVQSGDFLSFQHIGIVIIYTVRHNIHSRATALRELSAPFGPLRRVRFLALLCYPAFAPDTPTTMASELRSLSCGHRVDENLTICQTCATEVICRQCVNSAAAKHCEMFAPKTANTGSPAPIIDLACLSLCNTCAVTRSIADATFRSTSSSALYLNYLLHLYDPRTVFLCV